MGSMLTLDAMVGSTPSSSTQPNPAANCFPPHPPPPAPSPPKCPPCFAVEPLPPEPSPPVVEPVKPEAPTWCNCWQWSSCDCWQWCGSWQWKSHQHSWEAKPYRQTWYEWQHSKNDNSNWYSWRSWKSNESWQYGGNARHDGRRSSCCGCWQRRRTGAARHSRSSSSAEARLPCGLLASDYSDILFRDITPDDYELLLRLDETVERPTSSKENVDGLPRARAEDAIGEVCTVCLDPFHLNDTISLLPRCKHLFHKDCVSKWLLERHRVCPLCSVEVFPA